MIDGQIMANSIPKISIQILEIPTSLVLVGKTYPIFLQIQNNGPITGNFKILYDVSGIQIKSSDLMNKEIPITSNSSEMDRIEFIPTQKGLASLNLKITHFKEVIKEVVRVIQPPPPPTAPDLPPPDIIEGESETIDIPSELSDSPSTPSVFDEHFSSDISKTLDDILGEAGDPSEPELPPSPLPPQIESQKTIEDPPRLSTLF